MSVIPRPPTIGPLNTEADRQAAIRELARVMREILTVLRDMNKMLTELSSGGPP